ncbi:MAG: YccF domain-containing protein [Leptolyngbyaceae cyanobacterium]
MSLLGNIIWLVFGGFLSGVGYIIGGLSTCLTIIGIPFGIEAIKVGVESFTPFGKEVVKNSNADTPLALILNIIWIILFGWEIALSHLFWGMILAITIIGLPFARQHFKLVTLALWPFGRDLVPID